jgi:hypothetical protein
VAGDGERVAADAERVAADVPRLVDGVAYVVVDVAPVVDGVEHAAVARDCVSNAPADQIRWERHSEVRYPDRSAAGRYWVVRG